MLSPRPYAAIRASDVSAKRQTKVQKHTLPCKRVNKSRCDRTDQWADEEQRQGCKRTKETEALLREDGVDLVAVEPRLPEGVEVDVQLDGRVGEHVLLEEAVDRLRNAESKDDFFFEHVDCVGRSFLT